MLNLLFHKTTLNTRSKLLNLLSQTVTFHTTVNQEWETALHANELLRMGNNVVDHVRSGCCNSSCVYDTTYLNKLFF